MGHGEVLKGLEGVLRIHELVPVIPEEVSEVLDEAIAILKKVRALRRIQRS